MIKKILKKTGARIKKTYIYKACERLYAFIIHWLFVWKWMPKIMAYGGIHFIILVLLFCQAYYMWNELDKNNVTSFNQMIYHFYGDTLKNYRLDYLKFEKDMRRRPEGIINPNDIKYYIGYTRKDTINKDFIIKPVESKYLKGDCDLISKIKYITCNDIPDTIDRKIKVSSDTINKIIYKTKKQTNHERNYYDMSLLENQSKIHRHITNANDHLIEWDTSKPCFSFWIGFIVEDYKELKNSSEIRIKFNDFGKEVTSDGYRKPLIVEKVFPQPTINNLREIVFKGEELQTVLKQRGIFISGVDPEKKEIVEKQNIRSSVLLGTIIAFMLDIIVRLFIKWRKLKEYKKEDIN